MAIHQTKRQTDLEKRLQLLRRQVYGRENVSSAKYQAPKDQETSVITHNTKCMLSTIDIRYLHHDLRKILTFSSVAIGIQVILFVLLKNHILNLVNIF